MSFWPLIFGRSTYRKLSKTPDQKPKVKDQTKDDSWPLLDMTPKEIAAQYEAKVFDTLEAAKVAGFVLTETMEPRNVWNKASAAQAIVAKLHDKRSKGEATEIGLIIEAWSVTGCYLPPEPAPAAA